MHDPANFRLCPAGRAGHWIEVATVPEERASHKENVVQREPARDPQTGVILIGQFVDRLVSKTVEEVTPAYEIPTGVELVGKPGQTLEEAILAFEVGNPDEPVEFDIVTMMMGDDAPAEAA